MPFDDVMELALYHPELGFYASGGAAGRDRDFLTSPEIGPLFGAVVARALDAWWRQLGEPDPFTVVEAGAGRGRLAHDVLAAAPACAPALRYVLVERSAALRAEQPRLLHLEPPEIALGPMTREDDEDEPAHPASGAGPLVASLAALPAAPVVGVVLANELLDNLPFSLLERAATGWLEVRVDEHLREVLVPVEEEQDEPVDAPVGGRIPVQRHAAVWLRDALAVVERGRVVVVDYAETTASLARRPWTDWVRTYRAHGRGSHPLADLGEQDITCEVAVDQLAAVRRPDADRRQHEFLRAHGIDDLTAAARAAWQAAAAAPDLEGLKARSRVHEADALLDPTGLGAFRVLEWAVPARRDAFRPVRPSVPR